MRLNSRTRKYNAVLLAVLVFAAVTSVGISFSLDEPTPADLVRKTVKNELDADGGHAKFMFREEKESAGKGSETKLIVETNQSMVGMLVEQNGHPLTPEQQKAEDARLANYVNNPSELNKKVEKEKLEAEHTRRIVAALPDAFLYENDGSILGTSALGKPGDVLIRLKFRPNPKYDPPTHVEQVLTGMSGYLLIDKNECRIAKIDGKLIKDVAFGWGILGHLDPGGHFLVEQADVGGGHWEATRMTLDFTGKIMLFKSLNISSTESFSDFHPAPSNLNFAGGVELLKKEQTELAQNRQQAKMESSEPGQRQTK